MSVLEKLSAVSLKYSEIEALLSSPSVAADSKRFTSLLRELKSLTPIIEKYREYESLSAALDDATLLLTDEDPDLRALASEEVKELKDALARCESDLTLLLLPRDPNDEKNVIVEIRAGAGGEEAALFSAVLYRMYTMYADAAGFRTTRISANETELGGFREITFMIEGDGAYSRFKFESGVHRVQRVPVTESSGRIQTSTATVAVLPEVEEVDVEVNLSDCVFESCKSSGAGGQHINKTESAIRLYHKPSGIVIECDGERSQLQNKNRALQMLRAKLYDTAQRERNERIAADRKSQVGTGDRSERIRTYNYHENRVTDHRIGLSLYSLDSLVNGALSPLIDALISADTAARMAEEG
ncbi:MAG: peptide chain release factor 1 [Clostridia bacterium]|nr:peptide chain release factor 1 [Clostridia bacterium]